MSELRVDFDVEQPKPPSILSELMCTVLGHDWAVVVPSADDLRDIGRRCFRCQKMEMRDGGTKE